MGMPIPPTGATTSVAGATGATPPADAIGSGPTGPPSGMNTSTASVETTGAGAPGIHAHDAATPNLQPPGHTGCTAQANAVAGAHGAVAQGGPIDAAGAAGGVTQLSGILVSLQQLLQRLADLMKIMGGGVVQQGNTSSGGGAGGPAQPSTAGAGTSSSNPALQADNQQSYANIQNMFDGLRDLRL
jgi:hypothetical protein